MVNGMQYALIENNAVAAYPYSVQQLRADHPNTSFPDSLNPDVLTEFGVFPVYETQPEAHDQNTQKPIELAPALVDGIWQRQWEIVDLTPEEIAQTMHQAWSKVREGRNKKLTDCDWTQLPDSPLSAESKTEWAAYRQALRDVTDQADPFNIEWPVPPS